MHSAAVNNAILLVVAFDNLNAKRAKHYVAFVGNSALVVHLDAVRSFGKGGYSTNKYIHLTTLVGWLVVHEYISSFAINLKIAFAVAFEPIDYFHITERY